MTELFTKKFVRVEKLFFSFVQVLCGALWKTRNDHVFNNKIVSSPVLVAHRMVSLLRQWSPWLRQKEKQKLQVEPLRRPSPSWWQG